MEDILNAHFISQYLHTKRLGHDILVLSSTDSTNTQVKRQYHNRAEGFILLSETQTAGRGRMGRTFVSPPQNGLYFSLLLHPTLPSDQFIRLTQVAAVAVCEALEHLCRLSPRIKWVNDVFLCDKKICGILTESVFGANGSNYAVVGIGINLHFDRSAHPELAQTAGGLSDVLQDLPTRAQLAAAVLNHFEPWYDQVCAGQTRSLMQAYRDRLNCLHQSISVIHSQGEFSATCIGITEDGELIVVDHNGTQSILHAGEIRILV